MTACGSVEQPTRIAPPQGASDVKELWLNNGIAFQTYFVMRARYPDNSAMNHYFKVIGEPWVRCDWMPEWQSFLDGTASPIQTVHQKAYAWVHPVNRRILTVATRYYSSEKAMLEPDNESQQVLVLEYFKQDIQQEIARLKLRCPKSNAL